MGNPAALAAERRGVPYIESGNPLEPFLAVKADSGGWKYAFDFFVSGANLGKSTFQWLADYGLDKETNMRVATVVDNSADGPVFDAIWTANAEAFGWTEIEMPPYPMNATEFGSLITKLKESDADYVVALGDTPVLIALRKQMDAAGYKPKVMDFARGAQLQQFSDALGPLAEGIVDRQLLDARYRVSGRRRSRHALRGRGRHQHRPDGRPVLRDRPDPHGRHHGRRLDRPGQDRRRHRRHRRRVRVRSDQVRRQPHATLQSLITQWQSGKSEIIWPVDMATAEVIFPLP